MAAAHDPLARARRHLAPGSAPLVARQHEQAAAHEGESAPDLPFIGRIASYEPGRSVRIERELDLDEDLHLADHHFVPARPHKPLSACYPVLPLTFSLEIMAEAAACLVPGLGLTGVADVSAARWIALADTTRLMLHIEARLLDPVAGPHGSRIAVTIRSGEDSRASISATLRFGRQYSLGLHPRFEPLRAEARLNAADIYASRQLFHGPGLRCLSGDVLCGAAGASASLLVRAPDRMFQSRPRPGLLTDPALLDGVGQLIGIWAMRERQRVTFPIGVGQLEFYAATPAPGTLVPLRIQNTVQGRVLSTEVELGDGAGGVWLRAAGWRSWQFRWEARLLAFRRQPRRHLLSRPLAPPPGLGANPILQRIDAGDVADFDRALLARHYLHMDEMVAYLARDSHPLRQLDWLLGRIAAKDAARLLAAQGGDTMLHPAAFAVCNDEQGKPYLSHWPDAAPPQLSIAHSEGRALAAAHHAAIGVDIERIAVRGAGFAAAFSSPGERAWLPAGADGETDPEWLTRLWGAKEALGKLAGTAVRPTPHAFAAVGREGEQLRMWHAASGRTACVAFLRDGDYVCSVGVAPAAV